MSLLSSVRSRVARLASKPPREIAMFFVTSMASRALGIASQILQVAIVVKAVGAEAFGFWVTLTSVMGFIAFADMGLGLGAQNRLAETLARQTPESQAEARTVFGTALGFLTAVAIVVGPACVVIVQRLDFASLFNLTDPATIVAAPGAALAVLLPFCATIPLGMAQRLAFARQEGWMFNLAQGVGSVLSLAGVWVAARAGLGLTTIALAGQAGVLLSLLVLLVVLLRRVGWLAVWRLPMRAGVLGDLLRVGGAFGIQQVMGTVLFCLPPIIISTSLGAAAVTPYNLLQRIFNLFAVVQNSFMLPLWPAYSKARALGEYARMRTLMWRSFWVSLGLCVVPMGIASLLSPWIVRHWVGGQATGVTWPLVGLLFAWNAVVFLQQPFGYLLSGVSQVKRVTYYNIASVAVSIPLMYWLVRDWGAPGVVLGLILGGLPFCCVGSFIEARRYLKQTTETPSPMVMPPKPVLSST